MSSSAQTFEQPAESAATLRSTQPFLWSVRREIWEHRAIWIAPLIASGLVLVGFVLRMFKLPQALDVVNTLSPMKQLMAVALPIAIAGFAIVVTTMVVAVFYSLGALNNEKRDRSILFWKSLPVSDVTTVLSKAVIPLLVLPLVGYVIAVFTQLAMMLLGSAVLAAAGRDAGILWSHWPFFRMAAFLAYTVVVATLWYAPIAGWFLMVGAWAKRVAFLWAVLPWLGLELLEKIALDTSFVWRFVDYRINGFVKEAFNIPHQAPKDINAIDPLAMLDPGKFLATPGMWLGLLAAAAFIAASVYLRRMREPG